MSHYINKQQRKDKLKGHIDAVIGYFILQGLKDHDICLVLKNLYEVYEQNEHDKIKQHRLLWGG